MVDDPRPAPPVTIRDPSRPYGAAELLDAGPDRAPRPSPVTPRRLALAGAVVLAGGLVAGSAELRERRAASEQERRLASAVELVAEPQGSSASFDALSRTSVVELDVLVRNDGPREVTVLTGRVADFTTSDDRRIRPGSARPLLLRGVVACPDEPPPPQASRPADDASTLVLDVRTGAGVRAVDVPLPGSLTEGLLLDVCGFRTLGQDTSVAVSAELLSASADDGVLRVVVALSTLVPPGPDPALPSRLTGAALGPGLTAQVPAGLVVLPADGSPVTVEVVGVISDCVAATRSLREPPSGLAVEVSGEAGDVVQAAVDYDPSLLRSFVAATCP